MDDWADYDSALYHHFCENYNECRNGWYVDFDKLIEIDDPKLGWALLCPDCHKKYLAGELRLGPERWFPDAEKN